MAATGSLGTSARSGLRGNPSPRFRQSAPSTRWIPSAVRRASGLDRRKCTAARDTAGAGWWWIARLFQLRIQGIARLAGRRQAAPNRRGKAGGCGGPMGCAASERHRRWTFGLRCGRCCCWLRLCLQCWCVRRWRGCQGRCRMRYLLLAGCRRGHPDRRGRARE